MDVKEAVVAAKQYISEIYADEHVTNLGLEEVEHLPGEGHWMVTLGFSRPWNTPRTRAQEILENLGAFSPLRRTFKVITIGGDGSIISMKNHPKQNG
jgi:hypothetical protein